MPPRCGIAPFELDAVFSKRGSEVGDDGVVWRIERLPQQIDDFGDPSLDRPGRWVSPDARARGVEDMQNRGGPKAVGVAELILDSSPRDVRLLRDQLDADRLRATAGQET